MNIAQDIAAVEKFAKSLQGMDPARVVDTALKFMSSTRSRIEAGEKRIADLETKLGTALDTIDKLSGILGSTTGIDFSAFENEVAAMAKAATSTSAGSAQAPSVSAIAATTGADTSHVQAAVDAHVDAVSIGATPDDAKAAAVTAATSAGATDVQAQAIAAAIPAASGAASTTNLPHPDAVGTGDITELAGSGAAAGTGGKTILADGTSV